MLGKSPQYTGGLDFPQLLCQSYIMLSLMECICDILNDALWDTAAGLISEYWCGLCLNVYTERKLRVQRE